MNAAIITIGDELLIGQVIDTNSSWIAVELNKIGISVIRRIAVGDEQAEIIASLNEARAVSDLILITGGLGPTKDDITKQTLVEYFEGKLIFNEEIYAVVKGFFDRLNRPMLESNRNQAMVPDNCIPIKNSNGTAPGMLFEKNGKVFISMPGVPWEMKSMMSNDVIPLIRSKFKTPFIIHKTILTQGIGESFLSEKIRDIEDGFPEGFKLAYLPYLSSVRLRITGKGEDEQSLKQISETLLQKLQTRIGEYIWGYDNETLEEEVGKILLAQKATLSTAESCTGGLIAQKIVSVAGASKYFNGSIVAYSDEIKKNLLGVKELTLKKFGSVSKETVSEMAAGALEKMKSDYVIAVSGIAGPSGGSDEKPVGTIWVVVANKDSIFAQKFLFPGNRDRNIEMTAINALSLLRKFMLGIL